ncbi:MAG: hypothetical protein JO093_23015 [Acidobacteria bacterium]|nr:hypothetical protein [Acidobacteriota bacterium]MBV9070819.1 hypothetical protein [Acidobacteriota bacterium]MBV9188498.1 hypothetical protein [Acidobacteriota bacterium]
MRKVTIIGGVVLALIAAVIIYLVVTTPKTSAGIRFPLTGAQRDLVASVPESAESFALIPTAAALDSKLRENAVMSEAVDQWEKSHSLPSPWMAGGADLLAWRDASTTRYLIRLDPIRAFVVRTYMMLGGDLGETLLINAPSSQPINPADLAQILSLAEKLPPGDAFVVQRRGSRGAFPPIARPAVTSLSVTPDDILFTSRAQRDATEPIAGQSSQPAHFPHNALITATFATMPRVVEDLNRVFGTHVSSLVENGGTIAVYDIDTHKFLPRPMGVISVPDDPPRRAAFEEFVNKVKQGESLGIHISTAEHGGSLLLSFDDSINPYINDAIDAGRWPAGKWAVRADPRRLVPILSRLGDSIGLRIAAPRFYRSARDLGRWIEALQGATTLEAAASEDASAEELKVRISAK